jgi:hypothetical protein
MMQRPKEWFYVRNDQASDRRVYPPLAFLSKSSTDSDGPLARVLSSASYIAFGGVHCVAWSFLPHLHATQQLWRASLLLVTSVPPLVPLLFSLDHIGQEWFQDRTLYWVTVVSVGVIFHLAAFAFVPARLVLLVLPFLEFGHLPNDAFKKAAWDSFFPHIG